MHTGPPPQHPPVPYQKKRLHQISDDPPTIKLLFEHTTTDQDKGLDSFYTASRENKCVVCGEAGHYLRYRIVPQCYRRNMPHALKSHRSHDVSGVICGALDAWIGSYVRI
jgi:hypothetical protein